MANLWQGPLLTAIHACRAALQVALSTVSRSEGYHPLTELRTVPAAGRPNWDSLLQGIKADSPSPNDMQIFFCGAPALSQTIAPIAAHHRIRFRQEVF